MSTETVTIPAQEYRRLQLVRSRALICRAAQRAYFQSRDQNDLITAKDEERRLDALLRALEIAEKKAADLFATEGQEDGPADA